MVDILLKLYLKMQNIRESDNLFSLR